MREIKFRGKSKRTGRLIYGDLLTSPNGLLKYIVQKSKVNEAFLENLPPEEIEHGSDGQYTGLKDCKGQEIYKGDILYNGEKRGIVLWNEHIGAWAISDSDCYAEWLADYVESEEVIGNIYENPELRERSRP